MGNIVILGCGISGAITALALASKNIKSLIIERTSIDFDFDDLRTTSITSYSKNYLDEIGVWDVIKHKSTPIKDIYTLDMNNFGGQDTILHFESPCESNGESNFMGYMIKNSDLRKALKNLVISSNLIDARFSATYEYIESYQNHAVIKLREGEIVKVGAVLICEGRNSKLVEQYFTKEVKRDYNAKALVFNIKHKSPHENRAYECFLNTGVVGILPLEDNYTSSIVWSLETSTADLLLKYGVNFLTDSLNSNISSIVGNSEIITEIKSYQLEAYNLKKYYNNRLVAIADAAHTVHPLAGQGINLGIKDINSLVNEIHKATNLGLFPGALELENYNKARVSANRNMLFIIDSINKIFSTNNFALGSIRRLGIEGINKIPGVKDIIIKYAMGHV